MTESASEARPTSPGLLERALQASFRPVDAAWLAAFRMALGTLIAVSMQRFLVYGWVDKLLVEPNFRFKYWGFEWVEPLSRANMHLLFWVLFGLAVAMTVGLAFRLVTPLLAAGLTYIQLLDVSVYLNHYYLVALLTWLLAVSPAQRLWSVDAWISRRLRAARAAGTLPATGTGAPRNDGTVSAAWHYLFRAQVGIVYTFAGLAKFQTDWLLHGQPLRIWLGANTKLPILGKLFTLEEVPLIMSWCGFLFDTTIVWWLLHRKTRPWAYLVVIAFHTMTKLLFNIGMFPFIMVCAALVFFSPGWPRTLLGALRGALRWLRSLLGREGARASASLREALPDSGGSSRATHALRPITAWQRAAVTLGVVYCLVQVTLPLRFLAYGGNVLWHEQGMRFSWRVMVRVKGGGTTFIVRNKKTGRTWHVSPSEYLNPLQEAEMSSQPDLILQLAHHIQRDLDQRGLGPVEVRADSHVTLNGRRSARLIDPDVDLTTIRDGLGRAHWVLPAPPQAPPRTRPVL